MAHSYDDQYSELQLDVQDESPIAPGVNVSFLGWLILLGVPALLLFLVMYKNLDNSQQATPNQAPASGYHAPAH